MKYIDEMFKDANPVDTVNRILSILSENGLTVTEEWFESGVDNLFSCHLSIDGANLGTNGKGVTKELARASGYAELMERLQSGSLGFLQPEPNDLRLADRAETKELCGRWLERIAANTVTNNGKNKVSADRLLDACFEHEETDGDKIRLLPFYDIFNNEITYFPFASISRLFTTNGLAAGNSMEEALVQGFSEIVERHHKLAFFCNPITPPTIPEAYLQKFETASKIIRSLREVGFDVIIKDCSLGQGYPVIATILIDKKTTSYHIHIGCSPVFEIALERSLTEMFQGRCLVNVASVQEILYSEELQRTPKEFRDVLAVSVAPYPIAFFGEEATYEFSPFPDMTGKTNAELVAFIFSFAKENQLPILIRDMSCLGFGTYRIIVPGYSEVFLREFADSISIPRINQQTKYFSRNYRKASQDDLFAKKIQLDHILYNYQSFPAISKLMDCPLDLSKAENRANGLLYFAYVEWQCGNPETAMKYAKKAAESLKDEFSQYLSLLFRIDAFVSSGYEKKKALACLQIFYPESVVGRMKEVIENNQNPFAWFLIDCAPEHCAECRLNTVCRMEAQTQIYHMMQNIYQQFDNAAAFERIRNICLPLSLKEVSSVS